jgi:hypothetical protein
MGYVATACELARLGYRVALLRDSDVALTADEKSNLSSMNVATYEWDGTCSTEERLLADLSDHGVQQILELAFEFWGQESVLDVVRDRLGTTAALPNEFAKWSVQGKTRLQLRRAIGEGAKRKDWFKRVEPGQRMGTVLAQEVAANADSPTAKTIAAVEEWVYRG